MTAPATLATTSERSEPHVQPSSTPAPQTPDTASRRRILMGGGAAALGISSLALPAVAAASSTVGETPRSAAGTMGTPANFTATAGDTRVTLSWDTVTNATAYQVQYREFGSSTWLVYGLTDETTEVVAGLTNGTQYEFRVIASDGTPANVGSPTSSQTATPALTAPGTPVGVTAEPGGPGELTVTWSSAASGGAVATYSVRYGTDGTNWTPATGITGTSHLVSGLTNGTAYQVQVQAVNTAGTSSWTASATGTPIASVTTTVAERTPQPPVEGAVTSPTSVEIDTDKDVAENASRVYTYELSTDSGASYASATTASVTAGAPTFTVTGLSGSSTWIRVRKYESDGTTLVGTSLVKLTRRTPTYTSGQAYTFTNASGAARIGSLTATVIGGSGGVGGADSSALGGAPSQPGLVVASVTVAAGAEITLAAGSGGNAGSSGGSGGAGGTNAFTGYAGGNGAADGPRGSSGTGGGGGGASVLRVGGTAAIVAGGAGGGGGGESRNTATGANGSPTLSGGNTGTTNGRAGLVYTGSRDDAGGGGGGGGGAEGGDRGGQDRTAQYSCDGFNTCYHYRSTPSRRGTNSVNATFATATTDEFATGRSNSVSGSVSLEYLEVSDIVLS